MKMFNLGGYSSSNKLAVGLGIVIQISKCESNIVAKSSLRLNHQQPGFLKSCHLCNKKLRLDKDIYMYRGDQGFCSIECRNRQIVLDEMKEIETSTKNMFASFRHCRPCETQDHRQEPLPRQVKWAIHV